MVILIFNWNLICKMGHSENKTQRQGLGAEEQLGLCRSCEGAGMLRIVLGFWTPALAVDFFGK